jgi:transcriptional regulator with XRE-family HTH domain
MEERGLSDERLAGRLNVARETVTRWRSQQHRLNPDKIAALAIALDLTPEQLWRPPPPANRPSIDALLKDASDDAVKKVAEVAAIMLKTGT